MKNPNTFLNFLLRPKNILALLIVIICSLSVISSQYSEETLEEQITNYKNAKMEKEINSNLNATLKDQREIRIQTQKLIENSDVPEYTNRISEKDQKTIEKIFKDLENTI